MYHSGGYLKGLKFRDKGILYDSVLMQTDKNTQLFEKTVFSLYKEFIELEKNERILGFKAIN